MVGDDIGMELISDRSGGMRCRRIAGKNGKQLLNRRKCSIVLVRLAYSVERLLGRHGQMQRTRLPLLSREQLIAEVRSLKGPSGRMIEEYVIGCNTLLYVIIQ